MRKNIKMIAATMMLCVLTMNVGVGESYALSYAANYTCDPNLDTIYEQATNELNENGEVFVNKSSNDNSEVVKMEKYVYYFLGYINDYKITSTDDSYTVSYNEQEGDINLELQNHYAAKAKIEELSTQMDGMDNYSKVKWIHDWICNNVEYDYDGLEAEEAGGPRCGRSAYDAIVGGKSVCSGYSRAFYAMCSYEGIPVRYIIREVEGGLHSWNEVNIDGTWKKVDCTWDDQDYGIIYDNFMIDVNYDNSQSL